ncbi:hypothetical protein Pmani_027355 [Petrolisthes manimaculis]|uniref:Major facilitator superfamily (MFS) profile domain-containing protein n=1 Tax=Petrolisthes manimaculis TaxID=1843537 RepID=A0AAE1P4F2_9EUCA|nr:hypothetical protein Pmani_027355 [Petrolisthes manimaculis]
MKGNDNTMMEKSLSQKELLNDPEVIQHEYSQDIDDLTYTTTTSHNDVNKQQQQQQDTDSTSTPSSQNDDNKQQQQQQDTDSTSTPSSQNDNNKQQQQQQQDTDSTSTPSSQNDVNKQQQQQQQEENDLTSNPWQKYPKQQQQQEQQATEQLREEEEGKLEKEEKCEDVLQPVQPAFTIRQIAMIILLCYINLLNYMDRMGVAGVLGDIEECFGITDGQAGLIQTAFVLVYIIMAPIFGYLGDRYSRKMLLLGGITFWCLSTLIGSFMPNYGLFLLFRCLVGVGEASYSTIAPTLISDIFFKDRRSNMLALFYFAIPVGSGLGYIVSSEVSSLFKTSDTDYEAWRWGLRVTPVLGFVAVVLIVFVFYDPPRGESDGGRHLKPTTFTEDLVYLFTNKSYVLCTIAFTCVTFAIGALAFWGPLFSELGVKIQTDPNVKEENVYFIFGIVAMAAGLIGVPLGSYISQKTRVRIPYADPMVCGCGLLLSVFLIMAGLLVTENNAIAAFITVFFGQVALNLNWAVVSDIIMYITVPTRRSTAGAFQILISHAFGDAFSPYIIGVVADAFKPLINPRNLTDTSTTTSNLFTTTSTPLPHLSTLPHLSLTPTPLPHLSSTEKEIYIDEDYIDFKSKQYAMLLCCIINILGTIFFFWNACYIVQDKEKCDRIIAGEEKDVKKKKRERY